MNTPQDQHMKVIKSFYYIWQQIQQKTRIHKQVSVCIGFIFWICCKKYEKLIITFM